MKSRRAVMLSFCISTGLALSALSFVGGLAGGRTPIMVIVIEGIFFAACLIIRPFAKRGLVGPASGALLTTGYLCLTVGLARIGTIRDPIAGFYMALVIATGLLFDLSGMVLMVVISSLTVAGLLIAQNAGLLPHPDYAVTISEWIVSVALFACVGGLTFAALQAIRNEVAEREQSEMALRQKNAELVEALANVKTLSGMLPICCACKKIRDDKNYWQQVEGYIAKHSDATFTHSYCPDCVRKIPSIFGPSSDSSNN
jgi:hypothetical protein